MGLPPFRSKRYPLQVRHKQDWSQGFPFTTPTAALPGSNAGSDVIKPPSSFVIHRQTSCSMWCPMLGQLLVHGLRFAQRRHTRNSVKEETPFVHGRMESPHQFRRLSLTQAARGKPIPTGLAPVCTKARSLEAPSQYSVFHLRFVLRGADAKSGKVAKRFRAAGTNGRLDLSLTWQVSEDPLNRPQNMISRDPLSQGECAPSAKLSWLDA